MPELIAWGEQAVQDRGESPERHHASGVDLTIGLLLSRPVVVAVVERVAAGWID